MAEVTIQDDALSSDVMNALRVSLLTSPLLAQSALGGSFRASRGFSLTFTRETLNDARTRFTELAPFFDRVIDDPSARSLWPFYRRQPVANAFYVNLLVLEPGVAVARHLDGTLRGHTGGTVIPAQVSVLYLTDGGMLRLWRRARPVAAIAPTCARLVHFRGDLDHAVDAAGGLRASLVCEQYALDPDTLRRVPSLVVQSRAGFSAHLDDWKIRSKLGRNRQAADS